MSLIFIAVPTKGTVTNGTLNEQFLEDVAKLHLKYPMHTFIVPMIQDYQLLKYLPSTEATWADWGHHCRTLIEHSDVLWVLEYEGWDTSVGVQGEIEHAHLHKIPIRYIDINSLCHYR
jgi:hypothetical protein